VATGIGSPASARAGFGGWRCPPGRVVESSRWSLPSSPSRAALLEAVGTLRRAGGSGPCPDGSLGSSFGTGRGILWGEEIAARPTYGSPMMALGPLVDKARRLPP